ncbi:hypothetical protein ACFX2G_044929 [Malus domestica]
MVRESLTLKLGVVVGDALSFRFWLSAVSGDLGDESCLAFALALALEPHGDDVSDIPQVVTSFPGNDVAAVNDVTPLVKLPPVSSGLDFKALEHGPTSGVSLESTTVVVSLATSFFELDGVISGIIGMLLLASLLMVLSDCRKFWSSVFHSYPQIRHRGGHRRYQRKPPSVPSLNTCSFAATLGFAEAAAF